MDRKMMEFPGVEAKRETAAALLCVIDGAEYWIPKSHIDQKESEVLAEGDEGTLVITEWIATQKELV